MDIEEKKILAQNWYRELRNQIRTSFEEIDGLGKFEVTKWDREGGGGGEMSVMRGQVFEKIGVNICTVFGEFSEEFRDQIPGTEESPEFWASGVSLVAHMCSPLVPAVHMNTRFIVTKGKSWFGGGADLNPIYENPEDTEFFHSKLKDMCDKHDKGYYPKHKKWADEYFYLPHRNEPRGIGGIFFDYLTNDWEKNFAYNKDVGKAFLDIYTQIVNKHKNKEWTDEQRQYQLKKRGRYVEFNLLYDRGTVFGLKTGGNTEAILMSLPPEVVW